MTEEEEIQLCLNCPMPKCVNCLSNHADSRMRRQLGRSEKIRELASKGLTDQQIAKYLGIGTATVFRVRQQAGISSGRTSKVKEARPDGVRT